jgi:hypothetical protein
VSVARSTNRQIIRCATYPSQPQRDDAIRRIIGCLCPPGIEPGPQAMCIGLQRMYDLAWALETFGLEAKG